MPFGDSHIKPIFASPAPIEFRDATDPGVSGDIDRVLSPDTPRPQVEPARDDEVELPAGVVIDGKLVRTAQVRELHGGDEEALARAAASNAPERLITTLLLAGTVQVGSHPVVEAMLNRMLVGDRDAIILGIRRATFGQWVEFDKYGCPACGAEFALRVDLDDVEIRGLSEPGKLDFEVALKGGRKARVRHATGADQMALLQAVREKKLTIPEQDTLLLSRVVLALSPDGTIWQDLSADPARVREALSMSDRRAIIKTMDEVRPGPRLDAVPVTCPDCTHVDKIALPVEALFRG